MKRVCAMVLGVLLMLSLLPGVTFGAEAETADALYAGYNKVCIDPTAYPGGELTGLPLAGSGAVTTRLSTGTQDDTGDGVVTAEDGLFATCIAVTDQYDKTILLVGVDFLNSHTAWTTPAKQSIVDALAQSGFDVCAEDIFISASHTHSAPDMTYGASFSAGQLAEDAIARRMQNYRSWVAEKLAQAAVAAMQDRQEVTLTKGVVDASDAVKAMDPDATENQQRMNFTRHYRSSVNGETVYGGDNFGYINVSAEETAMVAEPVDMMHLVQFTPKSGEKTPIVLVNWNAHPTINMVQNYLVSSDYVNSLRIGLEKQGYRASFCQGASGMTNAFTSVTHLKNPDLIADGRTRAYLYGTRLSKIAGYGLENLMSAPLDTGYVRTISGKLTYATNLPTAEEQALISAMRQADPSTYPSDAYADLIAYLGANDTTWAERSKYYDAFPGLKRINSRYQLNSANGRMAYLGSPKGSLEVSTIAIGKNLAFVTAPNELADRYSATDTLERVTDNDWLDLVDDTYGTPIIMTSTNGRSGYIPHQLAYTYNESSADYAPGSYETQNTVFGRGTGEELVAFFGELLDRIQTEKGRVQCRCGGKMTDGQNGHTCRQETFYPWEDSASLPRGGNYYLTTDVTISAQMPVSDRLCLDLNGYDITHRVSASEGEKAQAGNSHNTRVFTLSGDACLSVTDSTDTPGTVSRDLSALTETQRTKITNYGLIMLLQENATAELYGGVLDSTGMIAGGGGVICVHVQTATFKMYGGTLLGGVTNSGGVIFDRGNVELYGGLLTGGTTGTATGFCPGVFVTDNNGIPGKLTLGGNVRIENNTRSGEARNIFLRNVDMQESFIVNDDFSGSAGVYVDKPAVGKIIGTCGDPHITAKNLRLDPGDTYDIVAESGKLVLREKKTAAIVSGSAVTTYDTLAKAVAAYPGGDGVLTLLRDNAETVTLPADAKLDLSGWNLTGQVTLKGKLYVKDSVTDDHTVADAAGYGTIPATLEKVVPMPGYLMATDGGQISFHKLDLETDAVTLRPSNAALYFQSRFCGDEIVRSLVKTYGVALGAGIRPNYAPDTYTALDGDTWDNGLHYGTLLTDILNSGDPVHGETGIYGCAYLELTDGTRYEGATVCVTLRHVTEQSDALWNQLTEEQKNGLLQMHAEYGNSMTDWHIPNIKSAASQ